jgi:dihydroorotate dehydrogenase
MYKLFIRKLLFLFPPELVHHFIIFILKIPFVSKILGTVYNFQNPVLNREICGITFRNPVGLAAGFDKNAEIFEQLTDLGFGFIEIGTITPEAQEGNPKPRIFRLPESEALINRMGFNNDGVEAILERLRKKRGRKVLIAGNIGKNKNTPNHEALKDYEYGFDKLNDFVDFFVVNVSSPNTPHLRELQEKEPLTNLLRHLKKKAESNEKPKPLFLKIAPDLNDHQLSEIAAIVVETGIDGIVATNTTLSRDQLKSTPDEIKAIGEGGLSGKPLKNRSTEIIRFMRKQLGNDIPIIGVGGIHSAEDALDKIEAGASLIEFYTGFIYEGPVLLKRINKALCDAAS